MTADPIFYGAAKTAAMKGAPDHALRTLTASLESIGWSVAAVRC